MPEPMKTFPAPSENTALRDFLRDRRSNLAKLMDGADAPPSAGEIKEMLTIAARVPDHRKLAPWRFLTFQGEARAAIGAHISRAFTQANPEAPVDRAVFESERFLRAPLVIGVISSPVDCVRGTPEWEQVLSAGAVCYNLCLAAQSLGYGAQWLTEWYAYDADVQAALGLTAREKIAGFIYIGPVKGGPTERMRPNVDAITQAWSAAIK